MTLGCRFGTWGISGEATSVSWHRGTLVIYEMRIASMQLSDGQGTMIFCADVCMCLNLSHGDQATASFHLLKLVSPCIAW